MALNCGLGFRRPEFFIRLQSRHKVARSPEAGHLEPGYLCFPDSSAMYMISCLKMNRLGAPSRVRRTIFLS